ncbi:hypothetical protein EV356DRAFT_529466 [Viridothelium virens]|uniref:Uncharacterized protein n=1 Tax=Viridothelium virens TaxID=1048519 RepID=A0A6A6HJG8_VIRVR|nr:hypothetical protein EV356DRAFT_529466 [Viridothelium virens]
MWHWVSEGFDNFQLDIVGFLAILGEGSVLANAQVATLSRLIYIPRLLPAPHAFLRPTRPSKLAPSDADVAGVYSGNHKRHVNHLAHVLLDGDSMAAYEVQCVEIKKISNAPPVKAKTRGPLTVVLLLGCAFSIGLLALSIVKKDGMSLLATGLLSILSSIIGIGNKWTLQLVSRKVSGGAPQGDVVIRYPKGGFHVVKCSEEVARELYFAPEEIQYRVDQPAVYRLISLVGTVLLMFGVIALSNATVALQIAWAAAYILLNAAYWTVAALPQRVHWELGSFKVEKQRLEGGEAVEKNATFTEALWKVIVFTKSTKWVALGNTAPQTQAWKHWLEEAEAMAVDAGVYCEDMDAFGDSKVWIWKVPDWDPRSALTKYMRLYHEIGA